MKAILAANDGVCCMCGQPIRTGVDRIAQGEIGGCWGEWVHAQCYEDYYERCCAEYDRRKRDLLIRYHQITGYEYNIVSKDRDPAYLEKLEQVLKEIEADWALAERITVDNK